MTTYFVRNRNHPSQGQTVILANGKIAQKLPGSLTVPLISNPISANGSPITPTHPKNGLYNFQASIGHQLPPFTFKVGVSTSASQVNY